MSESLRLGVTVEIIGKGLQGVVSYIGATQFATGKWIGVTLSQPLGKNDGEVQGKRYFTCNPNCGVFVRPPQIQVLDSPQLPKHKSGESQGPASKLIPPPSRTDRERGSSPSRQSRLLAPSSLQKPKSRLSYAPKPSLSPDPSPPKSEPIIPKPVEILPKPEPSTSEPVPVPAAAPPVSYSSIPSLAPGVSMVEVESLKGQVKEWKEKFETIRIKRQEERAKLKDFEKMRIQILQLQDAKSRASEQMQELSKQLREANKVKDEAIEAKDHYTEEMADVHETIEMATLDKEMAEEKADMLQKEVENLNDKVEELQTDLEILKAEIEDGGTEGAATSYQVKQLAEQNTKLKEALVRMRDLSAAEKAEYQSLEKQLEKRTKELKEMSQKKEKLEKKLETVESTVDELKEQVDASLGAEEMVEQLTDKNLHQEEKIVDMEEQIHDLESINEMNEELLESARDSELELREEVDLMRAKVLEAQRQTDAANEAVEDYQDTIQKFRKVVQELQEANHELRAAQSEQEEKSDADTVDFQAPAFNYQIKMVETKATARSIDHDLRKLDVTQASLHTSLLQLFMPSNFTRRAGDSDCIQVILLVKRFSSKAEIIGKHIAERFDLNADVVKDVTLLGVRGDQLTFASSLVSKLTGLQIMMDGYDEALSKCSVELFQKIGTLYSEMVPYERVFDHLTDLLRKDTLDETTNTDSLDKAVLFFKHLYNVHLSHEEFDCTKAMEQYLSSSQVLLTALNINTVRLKSFMQAGHETSDVAILLNDVATSCNDIKQFCKKIKRRIPQSSSSSRLDFSQEVKDRLSKSLKSFSSVHNTALGWGQLCAKASRPTDSSTLSVVKMQELLRKVATEVYEGEDVFGAIRVSLGTIMATMNSLVMAMQEGEYDTDAAPPKTQNPVEKRSQVVKLEMSDSEGLSSKVEEKDEVIVELRKMLKTKSDDVSESKIRIGMLERKAEKAGKEGNEKMGLLQQKLDSLTEDLKKKDKEYDETLDALQNDIDTLEAEKAELKQRLSSQAKHNILSDLGMKSPGIGAAVPGARSDISSVLANTAGPVKIADSPMLRQQIEVLQTALRVKRAQCSRLVGEKMVRDLKSLTPLHLPQATKKHPEIESVCSQLRKLSTSLSEFATPKVIDISKRKAGAYPVGSSAPCRVVADQQMKLCVLADQVENLTIKTQQVLAKGNCSEVRSDFVTFPTPQFVKSLSPASAQLVGKLQLNEKGTSSKSRSGGVPNQGQKLFLDLNQMNQLHGLAFKQAVKISS